MKKCFYSLFILLSFNTSLFSQEKKISFRNISINQGLSQSNVTAISKDQKGFMWFGTKDGLNKYDGYTFSIYKHDYRNSKSISDSYINDIYEDKNGSLWIATQSGLDRLDRNNDTFIHYPLAHDNLSVRDIFIDSKNNCWLTTPEGLYLFNRANGKFKIYLKKDDKNTEGLYDNSVYQIDEDQNGKLWVLTAKSLEVFDPSTQKFKYYRNDPTNPKSVIGNNFRALFIDSKNNVWVGARGAGISLYDRINDSFTNFPADPTNPTGLHDNFIITFAEGNDGKLWIGTEHSGVNIFDYQDKTFTSFKNDPLDPSSLSENQVNVFYKDDLGNIWVGTRAGGISWVPKYGNKFVHYKNTPFNKSTLSNNIVRNITPDSQGNWWIGTKQGGINVFDPIHKTFKVYLNDSTNPNTISTDHINTMLEISPDTMAIGYQNGGFDFFNKTTGKFTHYLPTDLTPTIRGRTVTYIFKDSNQDIWIGTWGTGISLYNRANKSFAYYSHEPANPTSLSNGVIFSVYEDKANNIWVGTEKGLNRLDRTKNQFTHYLSDYSNKNSLSNNNIYTIFQDSKDRLWIGTAGGLNLYNSKTNTFTSYTEKHGLPNNIIQSILEDSHGYLWISTFNGIAKFDPDKQKSIRNYNIEDGLQGKEFTVQAALKTSNGQMVFGGLNGFNVFHPDSIKDNPFVPPVVITDLQIFNKQVAIGKRDSPLQKHISETKEIILPYYKSVITFSYAALNFNIPTNNQYAYKLEGFDNEWNYVGNKRNATYTNLDPGTYKFIVKASNNDGLWNEKGTSITVIITPPFWRTWWFTTLSIMVIFGSVFSWYRIRINSIKKQKAILEQQVKERTAKIILQKEELEAQSENLKAANEEIKILFSDVHESIRAAKEIQNSLLPSSNFIKNHLPESFILYKPKDVVSGDFYWFDVINGKIIIVAADCTGHGVSGAFMSINSHHLLNQAIYPFEQLVASDILNRLNSEIKQEGHERRDRGGMDIALCIIEENNRRMQFAGANNGLYIIRNKEIIQIKADKHSIGMNLLSKSLTYTNNELELQKGDTFYIFSDGYADQMGGDSGEEKFMYNRFRALLLSMNDENMERQLAILEENLNTWKGDHEQLDDILVIGFKI